MYANDKKIQLIEKKIMFDTLSRHLPTYKISSTKCKCKMIPYFLKFSFIHCIIYHASCCFTLCKINNEYRLWVLMPEV